MQVNRYATIAVLCLLTVTAHAATLEGFNAGTAVCGPPCGPKDLAHRVVVVVQWVAKCPASVASIPHLSMLQAEYGREELVIIVNQIGNFSADDVKKTWTILGGSPEISVINKGVLVGAQIDGTPHCFLFSDTGKQLYAGNVYDMERLLSDAVDQGTSFLVADRDWKKTQKEAKMISFAREDIRLADTLGSLRVMAQEDDPIAAEEATTLLSRVTALSDEQWGKINTALTGDPLLAMTLLQRQVKRFKGDPLGNRFMMLYERLLADQSFQDEFGAVIILNNIRALGQNWGMNWNNFEDGKGREQMIADNLMTTAKLTASFRVLTTKYAHTKAGKDATLLIKRWGLSIKSDL